jgi:polyhydroxyalkanoate synthesis regulator phasin
MANSPLYRIGFVASKDRTLKTDGAKYNKYFVGDYKNQRTLINSNPSTYDTIAEIAKVGSECAYQVKPLATKVLMRSTMEETLRADWQFCHDYIQYIEDDDEEVRDPVAVWAQKRADCDCYATFLSSILICQGIVHYTDTVKMYSKNNFQHIFIIVPKSPKTFNPDLDKNDKSKYWILDPVVDAYNLEPEKITFKYLTKMGAPLYRISGTGNSNVATSAPSKLTFGNEFEGFGKSIWENKDYIQGLGCTADRSAAQAQLLNNEFLQRLKINLINTRDRLAVTSFQGKQEILDSYDNIISVWDNETLRKLEYQKIEGTIGNIIDDAKKLRDKIADEAKRALEEAQKAADEVAKKIKEGAAAVKSKAEEFAEFLKKINPIGIAGRTTVFQVFRNNTGGAASRMKWAYASPEIFVLNGQPIANQAKYKEKLADVTKVIKAMGGTEMELQSAIMAGDSLPQKPAVPFILPVPDSDKAEILKSMASVLKNEYQATETIAVNVVNTPGSGSNTVNIVNAGPIVNGGPIVNTGVIAVNTSTSANVVNVDTLRRDVADVYARPLTAPVSPFVTSVGVSNVSAINNIPFYSIQSGTLKGIDDSIKDIWAKIWEFIKELGDDIGQFCKDFGEKAVQFIKVAALALPRAFFLLLLKFNVDGLATAIALDPQLFEDSWVKNFGGERSPFKNSLADGATKKPFVTKLLKPLASYLTGQASVNKKTATTNTNTTNTTTVNNNSQNVINTGTSFTLSGARRTGIYDRPLFLNGLGDNSADGSSAKDDSDAAEKQAKKDALINAGVKGAEAYAQAQKDNKDIKATIITVCTAVGTAIGAACGGYGAIIGAPVGAAVGGLIALIIGNAKKPDADSNPDGATTTEKEINPDGSTTTVTKDKDGNIINSETKDKDGNIINPPVPSEEKKSNILAWLGGGLLAAKLLFASGALSGIEEQVSANGIKPDAPEENLSGNRIKQVTI